MLIDSTSTTIPTAPLPPPSSLRLRVGPSRVHGAGKGLFLTASSSTTSTSTSPLPPVSGDNVHNLDTPSAALVVVPKGTLLGWYGGRLLTPTEWVRKYAGGCSSSSRDGHTPNPADYTFHTPLGPLAWMCKEGPDTTNDTPSPPDAPLSIRLVHNGSPVISHKLDENEDATSPPSSSLISVAKEEDEGRIRMDQSVTTQTSTIIIDPYTSILGHYMNDVCGLVVATPSSSGDGHIGGSADPHDEQFKEMIRAHVMMAWGGGTTSPSTHTTTSPITNNAVVLKDMVFDVVLPTTTPSLFPTTMDVTHVCPVVAAIDITIPSGVEDVELTTSYGAPFWISRLLNSLFYTSPHHHRNNDGDDNATITNQQLQQQHRGWRLARWVREYVIESGVCADDEDSIATPLPCAVAVVVVSSSVVAAAKKDDNDGCVTTPPTTTTPKPYLLIQRTTNAPFSQVEECDNDRLRHVLAATLNHDPAVYKLPAAAVAALLIRLCPPTTTTTSSGSSSPPLFFPAGCTVVGTYFYSTYLN